MVNGGNREQLDPDSDGLPETSQNSPGTPSTALQPSTGRSIEPHGNYGDRGYAGVDADQDFDLAATIWYFLRLLLKRKWLISGVAGLCLLIGGLSSLMKTPLYISAVRIQIDREAIKVVEGGVQSPSTSGSDYLVTQYQLLRSRALAERVVVALQLHSDAAFLAPRNRSALAIIRQAMAGESGSKRIISPLALQSWATAIVQSNVSIRPVTGSRLVDIVFKDPDPRRAQRIANAYADAYIAANLDKRFQANAYAKSFLEDQIEQLKLRLKRSERELLKFAQREQIVSTGERTSIAENNLAAANAALGGLVSERIKNEKLWKQVEGAEGFGLPQLLSNSVIDGLRARRNALTAEYEEKRQTFKPRYPAMVEISKKIKEIDRQLGAEVKTIRQSLKAAYESSAHQESQINNRIVELRQEVLDLQKRSAQHNILSREVETNRKLYNNLLQRLKEVDVASGVGANNIYIVDKAYRPGRPSQPRLSRTLVLSLALGLGLGFGTAYVLEVLDDRVRVPEEVEDLTRLPTIGIIPVAATAGGFEGELADLQSPVSEAYRSLATALQFSTESGLPRSICLASASPGEGKSSTAFALARHFSLLGMNVLLIDADLRNPSLHGKLERDNSIGLSDYLTGAVLPPDAFQGTDYDNLTFMASGRLPPNAADLLGGTRMLSLVSVGLEAFDLIVVDGPPLLGIADTQLISSAVDTTVLVVGAGQVRKGVVRNAIRRLRMTRCQIAGCVLTRFDAKSSGYEYGYGYSYVYGENYTQSSGKKEGLLRRALLGNRNS